VLGNSGGIVGFFIVFRPLGRRLRAAGKRAVTDLRFAALEVFPQRGGKARARRCPLPASRMLAHVVFARLGAILVAPTLIIAAVIHAKWLRQFRRCGKGSRHLRLFALQGLPNFQMAALP
jgi:hypothetical protein